MSRFLSLQLDGRGLEQFRAVGIEGGWQCYEVAMGDHVFFIDVKKTTPGSHTMPPEEDEKPSDDEVAELIGRLFIAVSVQRGPAVKSLTPSGR